MLDYLSGLVPGKTNSVIDVAGVHVGHYHRYDEWVTVACETKPGTGWATGVTALFFEGSQPFMGSTAAVDVRGGGPGTRETELLAAENTVGRVHAICLSGGSAFGLASADGVMEALEERSIGIPGDMYGGVIPIVPAAVIFDLPVGDWKNRPDKTFGYQAMQRIDPVVAQGNVGVGLGARAGVLKGGIGTCSAVVALPNGKTCTVGVLVAANPMGSAVNPSTGLPWGIEAELNDEFNLPTPKVSRLDRYRKLSEKTTLFNTTIGVVATDANVASGPLKRLAMVAHDGLARAVRPVHSPLDGDCFFAVATGYEEIFVPQDSLYAMKDNVSNLNILAAATAVCVERAIVHALVQAQDLAGILSYRTFFE